LNKDYKNSPTWEYKREIKKEDSLNNEKMQNEMKNLDKSDKLDIRLENDAQNQIGNLIKIKEGEFYKISQSIFRITNRE